MYFLTCFKVRRRTSCTRVSSRRITSSRACLISRYPSWRIRASATSSRSGRFCPTPSTRTLSKSLRLSRMVSGKVNRFSFFILMAYSDRTWMGPGPGKMARMMLCLTFHTAPGIWTGQITIKPFLHLTWSLCIVISMSDVTIPTVGVKTLA